MVCVYFDGYAFQRLARGAVHREMDKPGPKGQPGLTSCPSKQKYKCRACKVEPRGSDIPRHYDRHTDWSLLEEMKLCMGDVALDALKKKADPHTIYIFENRYTKQKLPTYKTHAMVREQRGDMDGSTSTRGVMRAPWPPTSPGWRTRTWGRR